MEDKMQGGLGEIKICSSSLHEIYNMSSPETGKTKSTKQSYVEHCFLLLIFSRLFGYIHQCAGVRENEGQHGQNHILPRKLENVSKYSGAENLNFDLANGYLLYPSHLLKCATREHGKADSNS